jgi:ubiquinone/menaquinone biosynthesis C-methylase UbiE
LTKRAEVIAVNNHRQPLYKKDEARCLRDRDTFAQTDVEEKFRLLLENIGSCQRLVDIGCGWGQFLVTASDYVAELWGVDESPDQVKYVKQACPKAKVVICRADRLKLPDDYFDVAVTSQMLHEVKLFGEESELQRVLHEIRRILVQGGKYLLLDHMDAGEGEVVVRLPKEKIRQLVEFERKFQYYPAAHTDIDSNTVRLSKRCLQDFLSKDWSFGTPMESMEMNETHNVFEQGATIRLVESSGFSVCKWTVFSDISEDLKQVEGDLLEGEAWCRKFLLIAVKC